MGVEPGGADGYSAIEICSFAAFEARSTTQTALVLAQATKSLPPSGDWTIALGCSPTAIAAVCSSVSASKTRIFAPPQSETKTDRPSRATRHVYGSAGSGIVLTTERREVSMAENVCPKTLTP